MYSRVTANLIGAKKRYETLDGKKYLVIPTVMLDEGVWAGSGGPLLYTNGELKKNPSAWNTKPAIINHPSDEGTATTKAVLEAQGIGTMMASNWDNKLKTEVWADEDKLGSLAPEVLNSINAGKTVEVSTGLYHDLDPTPGEWNGKPYVGRVINIQPDHLAILPNATGAFSNADGGGLLRNLSTDLSYDEVKCCLYMEKNGAIEPYNATVPNDRRIYIVDVYPKNVVFEQNSRYYQQPYKINKKGRAKFTGEPVEVTRKTTYITANGKFVIPEYLTPARATNTLSSESLLTFNSEGKLIMAKVYTDAEKQVLAVRGSQLLVNVFQIDPSIAQKISSNAIMQGVAEMVEAVTKDLNPAVIGAVSVGAAPPAPNPTAALPAVGDRSNVNGPGGGGIDVTNPLNPAVVGAVASGAAPPAPNLTASLPPVGDRSSVANEADWERQWLASAPPRIRNAALSQLQRDEQERTQLLTALSTNQACPFSTEYLATHDTPMLRGLVQMAQNSQPRQPPANFGGQAGPPMFRTPIPVQTVNTAADHSGLLPFPQMGFEEETAAS